MSQTGAKYDKAHLNTDLEESFKLALPELKKKYENRWVEHKIESVWVDSIVVGQTFYVVHVKEGQQAPYHNYTVHF